MSDTIRYTRWPPEGGVKHQVLKALLNRVAVCRMEWARDFGSDYDMDMSVCSIEGCQNPLKARGFCKTHYNHWHRENVPPRPKGYELRWERFWAKVDVGDCWLWTGIHSRGYGRFSWDGHNYAHRWIWHRLVGELPEGMTIDHLCKVRSCVNPDHMEPVPLLENLRRGVAPPRLNALKTQCKHGHEFSPENTYWYADGRKRSCRVCARRKTREYQQRKRDAPCV